MSWFVDKTVAMTLTRIADSLAAMRFQFSTPGQLQIVFTKKRRMGHMDTISFKVVLPTLLDADVVSRELTVQVSDLPPVVATLDTAATESDGYSGEQDAPVTVTLVDLDDAGNRSEPSTLSVTLTDTFPPAKPGELSLVQTGEEVTQ